MVVSELSLQRENDNVPVSTLKCPSCEDTFVSARNQLKFTSSLKLQDLQNYIAILQDMQNYTANLQDMQNYTDSLQDAQNYTDSLQDVQNYTASLQDVQNYTASLQDLQNYTSNLQELEYSTNEKILYEVYLACASEGMLVAETLSIEEVEG